MLGWSWLWGSRNGAKPKKIPSPPAEWVDPVNHRLFQSGIGQHQQPSGGWFPIIGPRGRRGSSYPRVSPGTSPQSLYPCYLRRWGTDSAVFLLSMIGPFSPKAWLSPGHPWTSANRILRTLYMPRSITLTYAVKLTPVVSKSPKLCFPMQYLGKAIKNPIAMARLFHTYYAFCT